MFERIGGGGVDDGRGGGEGANLIVARQRRRRRPALWAFVVGGRVRGWRRGRPFLLRIRKTRFGLGFVQSAGVALAGGDAAQILGRLDQRIGVVVGVGELGRYERQYQLLVDQVRSRNGGLVGD